MLPEIVEVAKLHQLELNHRTIHNEEVLAKCPFCQEDSKPGKRRRFYLSLNSQGQVFRCWYCGESGGVLRFISLLEGVNEEEVKERYRSQDKRRSRKRHPVEQWSTGQRRVYRVIYGGKEPDWQVMRKRDYSYYLRTLDWMQTQWNEIVQHELERAYFWLLLGIHSGRYAHYIARIQSREKLLEIPLLSPVLELFSRSSRPGWTVEVEEFIQRYMSHP
ncbi:hypothetical protein JI735_19575 [Paenibacillus sonchi]|uniref:Zinc finger CHC2-type domain-containing protein n=1 Tax=Paenibacillus sonchi TaxID=373687 RepID=A0A974SBA1_9BACL|nr:hypothetical protein [Paenibacillus sonchi]QQZ58931.1 hypothetical protein JI735_19575 [Paenibacillus sonchi]